MEWSDEGLVLGRRRHGESAAVLELMTRGHGRHLGLVHGGSSIRMGPLLQAGNGVHAVWRARLDEHLGTYAIEGSALRAGHFLASPMALYGVATLSALLRLLPERDPHPTLHDAAVVLLDHIDDHALAAVLFVRFELLLLAEFGFGLDLATCAATGGTSDLIYVSPKSGRAVGAGAGEPYKDRLLKLPAFLRGEGDGPAADRQDLASGFALTGHFLRLHLCEPRGTHLPEERARFLALAGGPA
jgi:DNA repair protein RecO (recombination protein O)